MVKQISFDTPGAEHPLVAQLRASALEQAMLRESLNSEREGLKGQLINTGRFYVPDLTPIASAINSRRTAAALEAERKKSADLQGEYQRQLLEELRKYKTKRDGGTVELHGPPVEGEFEVTGTVAGNPRAFREFEGSLFPEVSQVARADRDAYNKLFEKLVERASLPSVQASGGDISALQPRDNFTNWNNAIFNAPEGGPPRVVTPVTQETTLNGTLVNKLPGGKLDAVDKAPKVNVNTANQPENILDKGLGENVIKDRDAARAAANGLRGTETALYALREGARSGFGEQFLQNARTFVTGLTGVRFDASAPTGVLAKTLAQNVLDEFGGKLGTGISNADVEFMRQASGGLVDDPKALERILAIRAGLLARRLDQYNRDVEAAAGDGPGADRRRAAFAVERPKTMFPFITADALASWLSITKNIPLEDARKIAYEQPLSRLDKRASTAVRGSMGEEWRREEVDPAELERRRRVDEVLKKYGGGSGQ